MACPTFIVNIRTFSEWTGDHADYAVIHVQDPLRERILQLHAALMAAKASLITDFDCTPETHFIGAEHRTECVRLCVADESFFWRGLIKHTDTYWETESIMLSDLDQADGAEKDMRQHFPEPEEEDQVPESSEVPVE